MDEAAGGDTGHNFDARQVAARAVSQHGALQKTGELTDLLHFLAEEIQPRVVLELGCDAGGTLWAWQQLPTRPRVIGVDLPGGPFGTGRPTRAGDAVVILGDTHDPAVREQVVTALDGDPVDFMLIDADHTFDAVQQDFIDYARLVRAEGAIGFHDICVHPNPNVGVTRFWDSVSCRYPSRTFVHPPLDWAGIGVISLSPGL